MAVGRLVAHVCDVSGKILPCRVPPLLAPWAACGLPDAPLWKRAEGRERQGGSGISEATVSRVKVVMQKWQSICSALKTYVHANGTLAKCRRKNMCVA